MSLPKSILRLTPEDYLAFERDAHEKHEYYHAPVLATSGGSPDHSLISSNVNGELRSHIKGKPCRAYESNLRIRIPRTTLYTYPDVSIICGERQFDPLDTRQETVTNPTLIVEVLSPSTETWDRGGKFRNYQQIDSLREYVLVSSGKPLVESFLRQDDGNWIYHAAAGAEAVVRLNSLSIQLALSEIYSGVEFPPPGNERSAVCACPRQRPARHSCPASDYGSSRLRPCWRPCALSGGLPWRCRS